MSILGSAYWQNLKRNRSAVKAGVHSFKIIPYLDKLDKTYGKGTVMKMGDVEIEKIDYVE